MNQNVERLTTARSREEAADRVTRLALLTVDGSVAITALAGGAALALGLEDDNLGLALLADTPFDTYLWPGNALATTVGGTATFATAVTARRHRLAGVASIAAGAVLAGWIGAEIALLHQPSGPTATEVVYLSAAGVMLALEARTATRAGRPRSLKAP